NEPYGASELVVYETMYPPGHPYRWDVIGRDDDINNATVEDVKQFFATYYVPNNLSLVVAGDFDKAAVKALVQDLFGTLPKKDDPPHRTTEPVRLEHPVRKRLEDKVALPRVSSVWHSAARFAPGD